MLRLAGPLSFGVGRGLRRQLAGQVDHQLLIIDLTGAQLVGTSTAMILDELIQTEIANRRQVVLIGVADKAAQSLTRLGTMETLGPGRVFNSFEDMLIAVESRADNNITD